ncbi:hypothetical protein ACFL2H_05600 [Planctomycetota bacterium]
MTLSVTKTTDFLLWTCTVISKSAPRRIVDKRQFEKTIVRGVANPESSQTGRQMMARQQLENDRLRHLDWGLDDKMHQAYNLQFDQKQVNQQVK